MQAITHLHQPTTQLQSLTLPNFLGDDQPCLCIVKHSSVEFLALPSVSSSSTSSQPFTKLAQVDLNARVLRVSPLSQGKKLAVLTDHHDPRLMLLEAKDRRSSTGVSQLQYEITASLCVPLDELARPPSELGLGVWTATSGSQEAVLAHTHSGILKVLPDTGAGPSAGRMFSAR